MPNPNNKVKGSGDVHLPEVESEDLPIQGEHPEGTGTPGTQDRERSRDGTGSPPRGEGHAGEVRKDEDGLEEG